MGRQIPEEMAFWLQGRVSEGAIPGRSARGR